MIYHVITAEDWQKAQQQGFYEADSFAVEGFIHMSQQEQVKGVLERYYKGKTKLLLLHVDESKLTAPLKYEIATSVNQEFPHIFGRLNLDAIVDVTDV